MWPVGIWARKTEADLGDTMSTSMFPPFMSSGGDDAAKSRRKRMMMAMMLQRAGNDMGSPQSPFAGAMQGLTSGIGNGLMIADMVNEFNQGNPDSAQHDLAQNAYDTTSGLFGQPSAGTSVANSAMDEFANGGQSPLSYGMNNFGQGLSNMGYGIGNFFGGLF